MIRSAPPIRPVATATEPHQHRTSPGFSALCAQSFAPIVSNFGTFICKKSCFIATNDHLQSLHR